MGIPDRRSDAPAPSASSSPSSPSPSSPASPSSPPAPSVPSPPAPGADASSGGAAPGVSPWAGADTGGASSGEAQRPPATVFAPPIIGSDEDGTPPPPSARSEARTELLPESGGALPRTAIASALNEPGVLGAPGANGPEDAQPQPGPNGPNGPGAPAGQDSGAGAGPGTGGGGVHHAATMLADPSEGGLQMPRSPGAPASPGAGDIADAATSRAARGSGPAGPGRRLAGLGSVRTAAARGARYPRCALRLRNPRPWHSRAGHPRAGRPVLDAASGGPGRPWCARCARWRLCADPDGVRGRPRRADQPERPAPQDRRPGRGRRPRWGPWDTGGFRYAWCPRRARDSWGLLRLPRLR